MTSLAHIVAALGGVLLDGGRRALIPGPGHSKHDRSVSLLLGDDGRIIVHCFSPRDDWRAVRDALADAGLLDDGFNDVSSSPVRWAQSESERRCTVVQPAKEDRVARARRFWCESVALDGSVAERYLRHRGIPDRLASANALRCHPRMTSLDDRKRRPALISAILDATGDVQGVEVTLLTETGAAKALVRTPRRVIGRLMGGAVRLYEAADAMIVAEGVETALSAAEAHNLPAWAALSGANLARFAPPSVVRRLLVASDADDAGRAAAAMLFDRLGAALTVEIVVPPEGFNDWNDWARASGQA
jgi:phage/plasmid primase-like uncharacterized protein